LFNLDLTQILDIHRYPIQSKAFHIAQNGSFQVGNDGIALGQRAIINSKRYTVTKANQNEAQLWEIAVLGMEKPPAGVGTFCPLSMLLYYNPPCPEMSFGMEESKKIPLILAHAGFYILPCQKRRTRS
jgi:hypothetical protein